jgi:hypothetical protein
MNNTIDCRRCIYHREYWDEDENGNDTIDDGCICENEKADDIYHVDNCSMYGILENKRTNKCPFFIDRHEDSNA